MTRKYRLERTTFIGCRNTAYMDVDDAEPCPFCDLPPANVEVAPPR